MTHSILITVCTYGRTAGLRRLLGGLAPQLSAEDSVLVVDNNSDASTMRALSKECPWVSWAHEPKPGIPAARNRVLEEVRDQWALIFIDDDEEVAPNWLNLHRDYARRTNDDVYFAPVISTYGSNPDRRVVAGRILERERPVTGTTMEFGPTNNTLVKTEALRRYPLAFDDAFTASGGSDVDFFARLRAAGASLVWNDSPVVYERVPDARATPSWAKQRFRRMGHNFVFLNRRRGRPRLYLGAMGRVVTGAAVAMLDRARGLLTRGGLGRLNFGIGMLSELRGNRHIEYSRTEG